MNKPLSEWTLGEVQKYCKITKCKDCHIGLWCENLNKGPSDWDLSESSRWTEQEIERAKAIKVLFTKASFLRRSEITLGLYGYDGNWIIDLNSRLFPSLHVNEKVTFDEIIGGGD